MKIEIDIETRNYTLAHGTIGADNQLPAPKANFDSVSFPCAFVPDNQGLRRGLALSVIAVGTFTLGSEPVDTSKLRNITFTIDTNTPLHVSPVETFTMLREAIIAAGIPLLTDEELRREIRDRKGQKIEQEA
ncbi:MAG: hypothetical protein HYZ37_18650 [Candidatus Solibacter usitatus]|nr:hypothetical protein [Candidatus Solibacter usitatus]